MRYAMTINGRGGEELRYDVEIPNMLRALDGGRTHALAVYRIPDDFDADADDLWDAAEEYLQSAGSAQRLSIELRRREGDGFKQCAVGREVEPQSAGPTDPTEVIEWAGHLLVVQENEVFTAEEAAGIYHHYWQHGSTLPPGLVLRELDLGPG